MTELFRPISFYSKVAPASFDGLARYAPGAAPSGLWPTPFGGAARTSRAAEPLVHEAWSVKREVPLGEARQPDSLLVGRDWIVVNGREARGIWDLRGRAVGQLRRGQGTSYLDSTGSRLIADDPEGGLSTFLLPGGQRDAAIVLSAPEGHTTKEVLEGPGVLVFVTAHESPFGAPPDVVLETVRVRDYAAKGQHGILYGLEPLAGILRQGDGRARAAAARTGPVVATRDGILWCDWQLRKLAEHRMPATPVALSVDDQDRACLVSSDEGVTRLQIVPPGGPTAVEVELPWSSDRASVPPIVGSDGHLFLTPDGAVMALSPTGDELWRQDRGSAAPGLLTSNGLLLLADEELYALTRDGARRPLWRPPAPLATAAVLAGGLLYVATAEALFELGPASA